MVSQPLTISMAALWESPPSIGLWLHFKVVTETSAAVNVTLPRPCWQIVSVEYRDVGGGTEPEQTSLEVVSTSTSQAAAKVLGELFAQKKASSTQSTLKEAVWEDGTIMHVGRGDGLLWGVQVRRESGEAPPRA